MTPPERPVFSDADLYRRSINTLVASWEEYTRESVAATLVSGVGVAIAVFTREPERSVYNNAFLDGVRAGVRPSDAIELMEATYARASITTFKAWVHERDAATVARLAQRGYTVADSTRAMGMAIETDHLPSTHGDVAPAAWKEHLRVGELPDGLLGNGDHSAFHVLVGRLHGESVATAMAFDSDADCGLYNVGTVERARRRGLGTALTVAHLRDAVKRGCETASLQSTKMAERVYATAGFRDLGRLLEYAPPA